MRKGVLFLVVLLWIVAAGAQSTGIETPLTLNDRKITIRLSDARSSSKWAGQRVVYLIRDGQKWAFVDEAPPAAAWLRLLMAKRSAAMVVDRFADQPLESACNPQAGCPQDLLEEKRVLFNTTKTVDFDLVVAAISGSNLQQLAEKHINECMQDNVKRLEDSSIGPGNPRQRFKDFEEFYAAYSSVTAARMHQLGEEKEQAYIDRLVIYNRDFVKTLDANTEAERQAFYEKYKLFDPDGKIKLLKAMQAGKDSKERALLTSRPGFGGGSAGMPQDAYAPDWCVAF